MSIGKKGYQTASHDSDLVNLKGSRELPNRRIVGLVTSVRLKVIRTLYPARLKGIALMGCT